MHHSLIFETVRAIAGRGLDAEESRRLSEALDEAFGSCPALTVPGERRVSPRGIALIQRFEGCAKRRADGSYAAYPDPGTGGAPWTIGWGATGPDIGPRTVFTRAQCDARLEEDVARHAQDVDAAIGDTVTTQAQFDALVSFHFNTGAIHRATLTKRHRAGRHDDAVREFARWNRAGGRVLKGLVRRRAAEAALYQG